MIIYSHPPDVEQDFEGISLLQHTENVITLGEKIAQINNFSEKHTDLLRLCCLAHDIGKTTTHFQKYIDKECREQVKKPEKDHWNTGAIIAFYFGEQSSHITDKEAFATFTAIACHHKNLPNLHTFLQENIKNDFIESEVKKLENIKSNEDNYQVFQHLLEVLSQEYPDVDKPTIEELKDFTENLKTRKVFQLEEETKSKYTNQNQFARTLLLWSTLMLADKGSLVNISNEEFETEPVLLEDVDDYVLSLQDEPLSEINELRESKREEVIENICSNTASRISLPTGFGKTLSGLSGGISLLESDESSRLIYALPYTSILDQVDSEVQEIFNVSPTDKKYTLHHHLATTESSINKESNYTVPPDQYYNPERFLASTWHSTITLSTFVQLFESFISPTKDQALKIPSFYNATIILDEPQTITTRWWQLVAPIIELLIDVFDATVILMTATQPQMLERYSELNPVELCDSSDIYEYLKENQRVHFDKDKSICDGSAKTPIQIKETLQNTEGRQNTLCICNTTKNSQEITDTIIEPTDTTLNERYFTWRYEYEKFKNKFGDFSSREPFTEQILSTFSEDETIYVNLSTMLRPTDRKYLLQIIRKALNHSNKKLTVVSTQLIEAGVDISFDMVLRDLGPFESIVQAAGRCNREITGDSKPVYISRFKTRDEKVPSKQVYTSKNQLDFIKPTTDIICRDSKSIAEHRFISTLCDDYYEELYKQKPGDSELVSALKSCQFDELSTEKLITQNSIDVIPLRSEELYMLPDDIQRLTQKQKETLVRSLQGYSVSLPAYNSYIRTEIITELIEHGAIPLVQEDDRIETLLLRGVENMSIWSHLGYTKIDTYEEIII